MALEQELATFDRHAAEFTEHHGEYVLVHGDEIAGFYESYEVAITSGYLRYQLSPFMVKQIGVVEYMPYYILPLDASGKSQAE